MSVALKGDGWCSKTQRKSSYCNGVCLLGFGKVETHGSQNECDMNMVSICYFNSGVSIDVSQIFTWRQKM